MKNLKSFPFERNRYFYGKLLSVEDFETEQKYFNDKRRTINRFLFGSGVVCGLQVVEVDEESISLERGLALDFAGREIVVEEPVVKRIADLDGYDAAEDAGGEEGFYYLCLDYQEEPFERMHNVAGTGENSGGEFNKYREGYRLFLTRTEPEKEIGSPIGLYEEWVEIYGENGIKIRHVLPRYLEMGSEPFLRIEVENTRQQQTFSFAYELELSFLTHQDEAKVQIHFDEKEHAKEKKYILEIPLKAAYIDDVKGEVSLSPGSFVLRIGEREYGTARQGRIQTQIGRQEAGRTLLETYYRRAMEDAAAPSFRQSIYLARIYVVKTEDVCLIERVERLPFGQYIFHTEIATAMWYKLAEDVKKLKRKQAEETDFGKGRTVISTQQPETACGEVLFDLTAVKKGEVLYSDRIYHGLGFGPVSIVLGYEVEHGFPEDREIFFGDASVFQNVRDGFQASLGARMESFQGAFVIGMKVQKNEDVETVRVRWSAQKHPAERTELQKKRLFIQPDVPNLRVGESIVFTTVSEGFQDERIQWSVKDLGGGTIDKNGKYTAPETAGVFRIQAVSTLYPEVGASTFVVVREKNEEWLR
ncbi:MAG: hypothetical protein HFH24_02175 [Ruminococcus sp.]|nr:hypothetical protein [Ruminococcus sp.]